jgi:CHAD domain-containing protein
MAKAALKPSQKNTAKEKSAAKKVEKKADQAKNRGMTWGDCAHRVVAKQYHRLVKQEAGVLEDTDPECLHQMRVATRRLRTTLQVFGAAVNLPKPAREKHVQALTKVLGQLRDLDVQMATLQDDYQPRVSPSEQALIQTALERMEKQRQSSYANVHAMLTGSEYHALKAAYEAWIEQPSFQPAAQMELITVLPDLLNPLLAKLLLHPGWLIPADQHSSQEGMILHELRKTCKQARYQTEFFLDFYGSPFQAWVDELKQIQENLGIVQDTHVLCEILSKQIAVAETMPELHQVIQQQRSTAMTDWDSLRTKYLDTQFRYSLHQLLLAPERSIQ